MAKGLTPAQVGKLARMGAAARLAELEPEIATLKRAFPGLKAGGAAAAEAAAATPARGTGRPKGGGAPKRQRRRKMSAAEKKVVSERMKKYWADRRKAKA